MDVLGGGGRAGLNSMIDWGNLIRGEWAVGEDCLIPVAELLYDWGIVGEAVLEEGVDVVNGAEAAKQFVYV